MKQKQMTVGTKTKVKLLIFVVGLDSYFVKPSSHYKEFQIIWHVLRKWLLGTAQIKTNMTWLLAMHDIKIASFFFCTGPLVLFIEQTILTTCIPPTIPNLPFFSCFVFLIESAGIYSFPYFEIGFRDLARSSVIKHYVVCEPHISALVSCAC